MTQSTAYIHDSFRAASSSDWWRLACLSGGTVYAAAVVAGGIAPLTLATFLHVYVGAFLAARALYEIFGTEATERRTGPRARFHLVAVGAQLVLGIAFLSFVEPAAVHLATLALFAIYAITWALQFIGQLFFWGLPGPALVGSLVMGAVFVAALLRLRMNPS